MTLLRTAIETAIAWYTSCYAMARGHCINIFIVLEAVHGILGLPPVGWLAEVLVDVHRNQGPI